MKNFVIVFCFLIYIINVIVAEKCTDAEYNPGPHCGLEPTCATRSSHVYPKHTCDCWCKPGTYRKVETNACVELNAECPSGEYDPGPDCSFEVICPRPSAHTYRTHYCDCWCNPGTFRDTETHACVEICP